MNRPVELARDFETRRRQRRVFCAEQYVKVSIRLRGEMRSHRAELLDISGFGVAVALTRPLSAERTAFLTLSWGDHSIKDIVCSISNCLQTSKTNALLTGYRCGLSFRPASPLQLDRQETMTKIDALLHELEEAVIPNVAHSELQPDRPPAGNKIRQAPRRTERAERLAEKPL